MIEAFIITLREGVEAALIIGIIYAYLNKSNQRHLRGAVNWGLFCAIGASILGAIAFQRFKINQELFEGVVMFVAAFLVGTMMIWMWRESKNIKKHIEQKVESLVSPSTGKGSFFSKESLGLFTFSFIMVLREGIETVLFLSAVSFSTQGVFVAFGGVAGLILAVAFGVYFVKGSFRINLSRFFAVTGIVLAIFLVQLLINGYHELAEQQIIPAGPREMALIGPIVRYNIFFIIAILSVPIIVFLLSVKQHSEIEPAQGSAAMRRKHIARQKKEQLWLKLANVIALGILFFLTLSFIAGQNSVALSAAENVQAVNGQVRISAAALDDGSLHRYSYLTSDGIAVRFIGIKTKSGDYRVALDACAVCGDYGYFQDDNRVICLNCRAPINISTIGTGGGCNPMELPYDIQQNEVIIEEKVLNDTAVNFSS
ncbi:ferrous iron permease EfeU [bacterium BMS3Abin05]|nr:ferrous iron permease EfeU [bacterium BMS3Abin05]GBE28768.1 ferrous iron permease EfeU [bacterium BMS3Bbin03]HEW79887.1 DUF2318 domain-containing protein [Phycisphaerales bacterium]